MNKLVKTIEPNKLYQEVIESLNGILQLTDREKDLLLLLISTDVNTPKIPGYTKNVISTENRKYRDWETDRKSTRLNSSHSAKSRMPSSA